MRRIIKTCRFKIVREITISDDSIDNSTFTYHVKMWDQMKKSYSTYLVWRHMEENVRRTSKDLILNRIEEFFSMDTRPTF